MKGWPRVGSHVRILLPGAAAGSRARAWVNPRFDGETGVVVLIRRGEDVAMVSVDGQVGADQVEVPLAWLAPA